MSAKPKRVFKGVLFDVYQWQQKMFDNSYQTFEIIRRADTVELIAVTKSKKIIVLKQQQPHTPVFYSLPGGKRDKGETIRQTAVREFMEETGFKAGSLKKWKIFTEFSSMDWKINMFLARDCFKAGETSLEPGEKIKVELFDFEDFLKLTERDDFWCSRYLTKFLFKCRLDKKLKIKFYN